MLVDINNVFITQREYPEMSLLQTAVEDDELVIYHKNKPTDQLVLQLQPSPAATCEVKVWADTCNAQYISDNADAWFTDQLSVACRLVYMPDSGLRKVDQRYAFNNEVTNFSDAFPLLMIGQASLDDLNSRLQEPLPINRFRPNIVFEGGKAYDEDSMEEVMISHIKMNGAKLCARCAITTINQSNASKAKEPLKTLAGYRMKNNKVYFGQNMLYSQTGTVNAGDVIEIIKRKQATMFDNNF